MITNTMKTRMKTRTRIVLVACYSATLLCQQYKSILFNSIIVCLFVRLIIVCFSIVYLYFVHQGIECKCFENITAQTFAVIKLLPCVMICQKNVFTFCRVIYFLHWFVIKLLLLCLCTFFITKSRYLSLQWEPF